MSDKTYVLFAATYDTADDAVNDFAELKIINESREIKDLTAALIVKDADGKLHTHETTHAGKVGAGVGVVGGAIVGALFPPAGLAILGGAVAGGAVLGSIGHFAGGISRKDIKELDPLLDAGQAAIIAVAVDAVDTDVDKALTRAVKKANKAIDKGDVSAALEALEGGADKADAIAGG